MNKTLTQSEIQVWLLEEDTRRLEQLWRAADETRQRVVGDSVHLRGLIEVSNHCARQCAYCGLRAGNRSLSRYRMTSDEIVEAARQAKGFGFGTVVLQGGEDPGLTLDWVSEVIKSIKAETGLAVTLSLGERTKEELEAWRRAGADRYMLRFETSDPALFEMVHPGVRGKRADRIGILRLLKSLGYETGSGIMVGLPGQSYSSVARDIETFRELDLDMIGIGPFIAHKETPLGRLPADHALMQAREVPTGVSMAYRAVALARLVCPEANIPATTAIATLNKANGWELALQRGANVVMPNLTPMKYRKLYEIYPDKAYADDVGGTCILSLKDRLARIGRRVGTGAGSRGGFTPDPLKEAA